MSASCRVIYYHAYGLSLLQRMRCARSLRVPYRTLHVTLWNNNLPKLMALRAQRAVVVATCDWKAENVSCSLFESIKITI